MNPRLGFVGIIIENRTTAAPMVNAVLSEFARMIVARTGLPYEKRGVSIITLIVEGSTDQVGALTGRLGRISGVSVKSALSKDSA